MDELHDLRDREAELTEQIAEEREKDNPDEERLDDLVDERDEVRAKIAEYETAAERAEQEVVSERW
jgi:chromosome segregation ATPase